MNPRKRPALGLRLLLATVAAGAVLSTAACSGQTGPAHSAPVALTTKNFASELGSAQRAARTTHMSMVLDAQGQTMTIDGDLVAASSPSASSMAMTMDVPGASDASVKYVGGMFYIDLGAQTQNKYLKVDPSDSSDPLASTFSSILNGADPTKTLQSMTKAIESVKPAGAAVTLDGVQAKPYAVVVDTAKLTDVLGSSVSLPATLTYTYWVGPDRLPRKMSFEASGTNETVTFSKWGEKVQVVAPSSDQIISESDLG